MLDMHRWSPDEEITPLWYDDLHTYESYLKAWDNVMKVFAGRWNVFALGEFGGREGREGGRGGEEGSPDDARLFVINITFALVPTLTPSLPTSLPPPLPPADLKNEPPGVATWGASDPSTDWNSATEVRRKGGRRKGRVTVDSGSTLSWPSFAAGTIGGGEGGREGGGRGKTGY